jgi:Mce-associated membrane protein
VPIDFEVLANSRPAPVSPGPTSDGGDHDTDHESAVADTDETMATTEGSAKRVRCWRRIVAVWVLPGLALTLAIGAGYLKWQDTSLRESRFAAVQSVAAASDCTVALLSYRPDAVERELAAARDRLTGSFRDDYWKLVHDVVIPGAKQKQITAVATVPAAGSITASVSHAVVVVFVDQSIKVGNDAPTNTTSSVRVNLEKVHDRWLISGFEPV